jgi:hypothetical protein
MLDPDAAAGVDRAGASGSAMEGFHVITDTGPTASPGLTPEPLQPAPRSAVRPRWAAWVLAAALVLAAGIGAVLATFVLTPRGGAAAAAADYVPASATAYAEVRLDLPGDQRTMLEQLLGHFSGVDVATVLDGGLDSALDQAMQSDGSTFSYTGDLKPWMNGQLAMAVLGAPSMTGGIPQTPPVLLLVGTKDATAASSFVDKALAQLPASVNRSTETYRGQTITTWTETGMSSSLGGKTVTMGVTVTTDQVIIGIGAGTVKTALDVNAGSTPALANRPAFTSGLARLPTDRVMTFAVDPSAMLGELQGAIASQVPNASPLVALMTSATPTFAMGSARFEGSQLVMDGVTTLPSSGAMSPPPAMAADVPGDAIFYAAKAKVGSRLADMLDALTASASGTAESDALKQVETFLGGNLSSLVSWIGDAAVAAGEYQGSPYVGIVITPTDASQASLRLLQLQGLLQLAGQDSTSGLHVSVTDAQHAGAKVTTITLTDDPSVPAWARSIQWTVTDSKVVIGLGDTFVERVLDLTAADSLAGQSRFKDAAAAAGGSAGSVAAWLDLAALRTAVMDAAGSSPVSMFSANVSQWLDPLDYAVSVEQVSGTTATGRAIIAVK